jgi:hypothetical protein
MAQPVEHNLRHGAAALEWLKTRFVIDCLGHAEQCPAPIKRIRIGQIERPGSANWSGAERHGCVDQPRLHSHRAVVDQLLA